MNDQYIVYLVCFLLWPTGLIVREIIRRLWNGLVMNPLRKMISDKSFQLGDHAAKNQYISIGTQYHTTQEWIRILAHEMEIVDGKRPWSKP